MSNIQWTDETWNPSTGCTAVSPGCDHCYAATMAKRIQAAECGRIAKLQQRVRGADGQAEREHLGEKLDRAVASRRYANGFTFTEHAGALLEPLKWKKPRRVFVCSMADLFHERATDEHIARVWAVMAACPQHTFQVLTKRPHRMSEFLRRFGGDSQEAQSHREEARRWLYEELGRQHIGCESMGKREFVGVMGIFNRWPLPNVWLGTSVENMAVTRPGWHPGIKVERRKAEGESEDGSPEFEPVPGRIDALLSCPAAVRFLSCEPLLGELDLSAWLRLYPVSVVKIPRAEVLAGKTEFHGERGWSSLDAALAEFPPCSVAGKAFAPSANGPRIHWLICGGESGPGARPMHPAWARSLREQCAAAGVAFFMKQFGAWLPAVPEDAPSFGPKTRARVINLEGEAISSQLVPAIYPAGNAQLLALTGGHNGDPEKWPAHLADLKVRQFPEARDVG